MEARHRSIIALGAVLILTLAIVGLRTCGGPRSGGPAPPRADGGAEVTPGVSDEDPAGDSAALSPAEGEKGEEPAEIPLPEQMKIPVDAVVVDGETGRVLADAVVTAVDGEAMTARPGEIEDLRLRVVLPEGYVLARGKVWEVTETISRLARRALLTIIAWPEARVWVKVLDDESRPVAGAEILSVTFLKKPHECGDAAPTGADGRTFLPGLPALPGEQISVIATQGERWGVSPSVRLRRSGLDVEAKVLLDRSGDPQFRLKFGGRRDRRWLGRPLKFKGDGRLTVRLRGVDGKSIAGVSVSIRGRQTDPETGRSTSYSIVARTGSGGAAAFSGLPPGRIEVQVVDGALATVPDREIDLEEGGSAEVALRATPGLPVYVLVRDREGQPVPGVALTVGIRYAFVADGVQRLGIYTDRDGRAVIPDLPEQEISIHARIGTRYVHGKVTGGGLLELTMP